MEGTLVAIETSTRLGSVAVRAGAGAEVHAADLHGERAHAADLLPALEGLLARAGSAPGDIAGVLVGTGPGSYTGLRVGVATALGLVLESPALLRGVPSGEAVCWGELQAGEEGAVLLDARQGAVYFARYRRLAKDVEVLVAPCAVRPEELEPAWLADARLFTGPGALAAAGLEEDREARDARPTARAVLELGELRMREHGGQEPHEVEPLYLQPFVAKQRRR